MLTTLEKCINFATTVEEGEYRLYFQIIKLVASYTKEKLQVLLNLISFINKEN